MSTNRPAFGMTHEQLEREWVEARDKLAALQKDFAALEYVARRMVDEEESRQNRELWAYAVAIIAFVITVWAVIQASRKLDTTPPPPPAAVEVSYAADEPRGWWWRLMPRSVRPITVTRRIWTMTPA